MTELAKLRSLLARAHKALIVSHVMPDGDTLGSALGLSRALNKIGIATNLSCADPIPPTFAFLPGVDAFSTASRVDEDIVFVIDCSDQARMGSIYDSQAFADTPLIVIDHHITNRLFGDLNFVRETAATSELVLEIIKGLGIPLDAAIATCLLTALVTDTRCFRTSSTTRECLLTAVELGDAGASLAEITDAVFNHRALDMLHIWGPALSNIQQQDGIVWTIITRELLHQAGVDDSMVSGLVNFVSSFHEARIAIVFHEQEDGTVDVSMRSSPGINVSETAFALGGGGHPQAAGCSLPGPVDSARNQVLARLLAIAQAPAL